MHYLWKGARVSPWLAGLVAACLYLYFAGLGGWFLMRLAFGDRWWWLFLINTFAVYLFLPLPLALLGALAMQRVDLWVGVGAALLLGAYLYGGLFLPRLASAPTGGTRLTVMTYNMLVYNLHTADAVAALRDSQADVISLQELNTTLAAAIKDDLHDQYPYQLLDAHTNDNGMGIISRYPLRPTGRVLPGPWIGTPQVVEVDVNGTSVTIINLHNYSFPLGKGTWRADFEFSARQREHQAQQIVALAAAHVGPLLVMGDFNTSEMSAAYRILTSKLHDSWREGGYGFGHTFPGGTNLNSSRPSVKGIKVPEWLVRIDYIFHSDDWRVVTARIGPWDGHSDHRPVIAELVLK